MRKQAERMADTFGLDTMEQLLAKVERSEGGGTGVWCAGLRPAPGAPGVRNRNTAVNSVSRLTGLTTNLSVNNHDR